MISYLISDAGILLFFRRNFLHISKPCKISWKIAKEIIPYIRTCPNISRYPKKTEISD